MSLRCGLSVLALALLVSSCGGAAPPTGPSGPADAYDVVAIVFSDDNGNGRLDPGEDARVGDVEVVVDFQSAGVVGRSEPGTGRVVLAGLAAGTHEVSVHRQSLPPFYRPSVATVTIDVPLPAGAAVGIPVTIPIGRNRPATYMAFGDSITIGDGSSDRSGYRDLLQADLQGFFGRAAVIDEGVEGTRSDTGADRIGRALDRERPAETLILYGANDWNDYECKRSLPCFTTASLRTIVRTCRAADSVPFLATILPANPNLNPPERNNWVHAIDQQIRPIAEEEGAVLVDVEAAFLKEGNLAGLFSDHVHPNDRGYEIIARTFFAAITQPSGLHVPGASFGPTLFEAPLPAGPLPPGSRPLGRDRPARLPGTARSRA